jgi:hypothetical protein
VDSRSGTPLDLTGLSNGAGPAMTGLQTVVRLYYRTARAPFLSVRSVSTKKERPPVPTGGPSSTDSLSVNSLPERSFSAPF